MTDRTVQRTTCWPRLLSLHVGFEPASEAGRLTDALLNAGKPRLVRRCRRQGKVIDVCRVRKVRALRFRRVDDLSLERNPGINECKLEPMRTNAVMKNCKRSSLVLVKVWMIVVVGLSTRAVAQHPSGNVQLNRVALTVSTA